MDFKQIEAFISVAKLKSFSKAANTIYLSQPTISSHIASLEKDLNIKRKAALLYELKQTI